jgi:type 1 glutamine amidotransferase
VREAHTLWRQRTVRGSPECAVLVLTLMSHLRSIAALTGMRESLNSRSTRSTGTSRRTNDPQMNKAGTEMRRYPVVVAVLAACAAGLTFVGCSNGAGAIGGSAGTVGTVGSAGNPAVGTGGTPDQGTAGAVGTAGDINSGTAGAAGGLVSMGGAVGSGGSPVGAGGSPVGASGGPSGGASGAAGGGAVGADPYSGPFKILVLSKNCCGGFHHDSIPACEQLLRDLGKCADAASCTAAGFGDVPITGAKPNSTFTVDVAGAPATGCPEIQSKPANASATGYAAYNAMGCDGSTSDLSEFNATNLDVKQFSSPTAPKGKYQMIFFCSPTGEDFTQGGANGAAGETAIQNFITAGGGYGGLHAASDFENGEKWQWYYNTLMGSWFANHNGDGTPGTVVTAPMFANHPVMRGIPNPWNTQDEWYLQNREMSSLPGFQILATLSGVPALPGEAANDIRPAIWAKQFPVAATPPFEGRMFYTIRGHNIARYGEAPFRQFVHQGVLWAANRLN